MGVILDTSVLIAAERGTFDMPSYLAGIPFGLTEARVHARVWASLAAAGTLIGAHDLQIAATALVTGSAVATLNRDEFRRVPALALALLDAFLHH